MSGEEMLLKEQLNAGASIGRVAVVVPRYGKSLGGGAESLIRSYVENIFSAKNGFLRADELEVWTTCAIDHRTWENHYKPGDYKEEGITVRRFPVDKRNLEIFLEAEFAFRDGRPLSVEDQLRWLENGVNSRALYAHIQEHGESFDIILFAPYLFPVTFWGALIYPERSVVVPCLHNEPYAYQDVFKSFFKKVRGLLFNAEPELELAESLYRIPELRDKSAVVGMGFEQESRLAADDGKSLSLANADAPLVQSLKRPYLLYSGRKEEGKNLDLLISWYSEFRSKQNASELDLVLIGSGDINFLDELPDGVVDCGFVSEADKERLMKNCVSLCQFSVNESFSIVLMEAWLHQAPVLVHADCSVTRDHVVKSDGGLFAANAEEFSAIVKLLLEDDSLRKSLGSNGYTFVREEYSWEAVTMRMYTALKKFGFLGHSKQVNSQAIQSG